MRTPKDAAAKKTDKNPLSDSDSGGFGFRIRLDDATNANMRVDSAWAEGAPLFYFNFG